jgi:hypothetical protein
MPGANSGGGSKNGREPNKKKYGSADRKRFAGSFFILFPNEVDILTVDHFQFTFS